MTGSNSKVLSQGEVQISDTPVRVGNTTVEGGQAAALDSGQEHAPEISVEHDADGNVALIRIRCSCGEDIAVACEYSDAA